ncbi:MAG: hypothetical protein ACK5P5_02585 [Pseudobdellovibrionaceae bacterium]
MSSSSEKKAKANKRLLQMCHKITKIYKHNPEAIPKDDLKEAANLVSIFENTQFGPSFQDIFKKKIELYEACLLDVAMGADLLRTGSFQICFTHGKLQVQHKYFGDPSDGELVYSVTLKNQAAFQNFKQNEADEISQDDINRLCLYFACARAGSR